MKEQIIGILEGQKKAINLMQINDLLALKTADEFQELTNSINELIKF